MKKTKIIVTMIACALVSLALFAFAACGGDSNTSVVESVTLDKTVVTLGPGDTQRLNATVKTTDGSEVTVEWSSSNQTVATVTRGVIAAKSAGKATITAKAGDKTATCEVTVDDIKLELDKSTLALERWAEGQLAATVKKNGVATDDEIEWSTSDANIAAVDATGKVTAVGEGEATVTATRKGANQKAECAVTVTWTKPKGYAKIANFEQNKVPVNTWGYWDDRGNWVGGMAEMHEAYYQDSDDSEAGKVNFTFTVSERSTDEAKQKLLPSMIQITYRSSTGDGAEGAKLDPNFMYEISLELTSSVDGEVVLNDIDTLVPEEDKEPATKQAVKANVPTTLKSTFRHGDWGVIYPTGTYDNVESAVFLLLGLLGKEGEKVTVSVDKVHWTKLEEAEQKTEKPDFSTPVVNIPDLSATAAIAVTLDKSGTTEADNYTITPSDEGKTQNVVYADVTGGNYANMSIDLTETNAKDCNTFAVTITNNGTTSIGLRFDVACANAIERGANTNSKDCAIGSVATVGTASTDNVWDGTTITIGAGETTTLYITYDPKTERGDPVQLLIYFETHYWENSKDNPNGTQATYSGNVTFSEFKFANVVAENEEEA